MIPARVHATRLVALSLAMPFALGVGARAQVTIQLRGGAADRSAAAVNELDRGLELRIVAAGKPETRELIPWDEVRGVVDPSGRASASESIAVAQDLWRARIRVARGDAALAKPLLARHWKRLRGVDGPTAQLAAEGLLRAALADGDLVDAVAPWVECLRLGLDGEPTRFPALPAVLDDSTGLLPGLAPFAPSELRGALATALGEAAAATRPTTAATTARAEAASVALRMRRLLELSGGAADAGAQPAPAANADPAAVRALAAVEAIMLARDLRARERAVADFDRLFPEPSAFLAAWRLAAIGAGSARAARAAAPEDRRAALLAAALDNLAVPASGLDKTGLVDAAAIEAAEMLTREAGDGAAAAALASLKAERLRDAAVRIGPAPAAGNAADGAAGKATRP